jgi:autotransporter-associated beta strand protein
MKRRPIAFGLLLLTSAGGLIAQTWDGGGSNARWNTANNWNPNGVPAFTSSTNLTFGGSTRLVPDLNGNRTVHSLTFAVGAGSFTVIGDSGPHRETLTLAGSNPYLQQLAANDQSLVINRLNWSASGSIITTGAGNLSIGDGTATNGQLYGAGDITKTGTGGGLVLNADNSNWSGDLTISQGVVQALYSGSSLGTGTTTVSNGAVLQLGTGGLTWTNDLFFRGDGPTGAGALRNVATSGTNTLSGTLTLSADARLGADNGSTLLLSGTLAAANHGLTVDTSGDVTISGTITGTAAGSITKTGTGTLVLAGANSYLGSTNLSNGAIEVTHDGGLAGAGVVVSDGATLRFAQTADSANIQVGGVAATIHGTGLDNGGAIQNLNGDNSYAGAVTLAAAASITANAGSTLTLFGRIDPAGASHQALTVGGTGNLIATAAIKNGSVTTNSAYSPNGGANTYTVITGVGAGGTLEKVDSGTFTFAGNATSELDGLTLTLGNITVGDGSSTSTFVRTGPLISSNASNVLTISANSTLAASYTVPTIGAANTFTGQLAGAGTFQKDGAGILAFDASFAAPSLTLLITGGEIALRGGVNITVGTIHIAGNTILDFDGLSTTSLTSTHLILDSGVTVTVNNLAAETDFWFATGSFLGLSGVTPTPVAPNTDGQPGTPQSQITFANWSNLNTAWIQSPYAGYTNHEIRPVPEPATYGAWLLLVSLAIVAWRRRRPAA